MQKEAKDELKQMSVQNLMPKLRELEADLMRMESKCNFAGGSVRAYPKEKSIKSFGNIQKIKKNIARVKTFLNVKLKADHFKNATT